MALALHAGGATAGTSLEKLVSGAQYQSIRISPEGDYLAARIVVDGRWAIGIIDLKDRKRSRDLTLPAGESVAGFHWVGPRRLVIEGMPSYGTLEQEPLGVGDLQAIDADGRNFTYLFGPRHPLTTKSDTYSAIALLDTRTLAPDAVLLAVQAGKHDADGEVVSEIIRVNVHDASTTVVGTVSLPVGFTMAFDPVGRPLLAAGSDRNEVSHLLEARTGDDGSLRWADAVPPDPQGRWQPRIVGRQTDQPDQVVILSGDNGAPNCVRRYDVRKRETVTITCDARVDVGRLLLSGKTGAPVAVLYEDGLPRVDVLDPESSEGNTLQALLAAFKQQRVWITSATTDGNRFVALVESDRNPGDFYLFDRSTRKAEWLLARRPWIESSDMLPMEPITFKARDGMRMDGYLTRPSGVSAPSRMILLPHGGPHGIRDRWEWQGEVQWLARRGYAVLQVNYRGSGGYGFAHEQAGFGHWGTAMQDDLADAVHWAIDAGIARQGEVCIYGVSYGGYAALMSAIREPGLFSCAASFAGVYDLETIASTSDPRLKMTFRRFFDRVLGADTAERKRQSPIALVDQLQVPVFMAHGTLDDRCPYALATRMRDAMKAARKRDFEWRPYAGEVHGFINYETHTQYMLALTEFFDRHVGRVAASAAGKDSSP